MTPNPPKVERLDYRPGDTFVLSASGPLTMEQAANLRRQWREQFPSSKLLVLDGIGVQIIRRLMRSDLNPMPRFRLFRWLP